MWVERIGFGDAQTKSKNNWLKGKFPDLTLESEAM